MKYFIFSICILLISVLTVSCNNNEQDAAKKMKTIDAPKKHDSTEWEKEFAVNVESFKRFKELSYDSVVMKDYDRRYNRSKLKFKSKSVILSAAFRDTLKQIILNDTIWYNGFHNCFDPHQFIYLFYQKDTVGIINICHSCSGIVYENKITQERISFDYDHDKYHTLEGYAKLCSFYKLGFCPLRREDE